MGEGLIEVSLEVNGTPHDVAVAPDTLLVELLRERLALRGTRVGCLTGDCGACTILVAGTPRKSCLMLAAAAGGLSVTTIEGLSADGSLSAVQRAFCDEHAFQCGYCTAGMVLVVHELLAREPDPSEQQVREALAGNLCRCTGYDAIVAAAMRAARALGEER